MGDGLMLRCAEPGDELAVAAVHVAGWQAGYAGLLPASYLDGLRVEDRAARYTFGDRGPGRPVTVLAVDDSGVVGFVVTGPARVAANPTRGELYALYVQPERWRQGIGHALLVDARRRLIAEGFVEASLWALEGNERAERFYRADGWRPVGARRREHLHGIEVDEVEYRRDLPS